MRTVLYAAIIAIAGGIMIFTLATRDSEGISSHPRPQSDVGAAVRRRRAQRLHHPHRQQAAAQARFHHLLSTACRRALIDFVGVPPRADGQLLIDVGPDQTREVRVVVTDYGDTPPAIDPIVFRLTDVSTGEQAEARDHFFGP